jgi:hypothetical protein
MSDVLLVDGRLILNRLKILNRMLIATLFPSVYCLCIELFPLSTMFNIMIGVTLRWSFVLVETGHFRSLVIQISLNFFVFHLRPCNNRHVNRLLNKLVRWRSYSLDVASKEAQALGGQLIMLCWLVKLARFIGKLEAVIGLVSYFRA